MGTDVKSTASGYVYQTGWFESPSLFMKTDTLINSNQNGIRKDIFLAKYDTSGNEIWTRSVGSSSDDVSFSTAVDGNDNVFITGSFESADLSFENITVTNSGYIDMFLAKYSPSGHALWVNTSQSELEEAGTCVRVDNNGDVYLCGYFMGTSTYLNGVHLISRGLSDIFVAKYNNNGSIYWAKYTGGTTLDKAFSISVDQDGYLYTVGGFVSPWVVFGTDTVFSTSEGAAVFTAKMASTSGVEIIENNHGLIVYPNPISNMINAVLPENKEIISCELISVTGNIIKTGTSFNKNKINLSINNIPHGIYFLRLTTKDDSYTAKVIVD